MSTNIFENLRKSEKICEDRCGKAQGVRKKYWGNKNAVRQKNATPMKIAHISGNIPRMSYSILFLHLQCQKTVRRDESKSIEFD